VFFALATRESYLPEKIKERATVAHFGKEWTTVDPFTQEFECNIGASTKI